MNGWDRICLIKTIIMYRASFGHVDPHSEEGMELMTLCARKVLAVLN